MKLEVVQSDITIVGGGLSGICAAIAAARNGRTVALVQNRPVLGGNSSSEIRVWVVGATAHGVNRYARETGIMGELFVENQYRNPEGNPYLWDLILLEKVRAERNLSLFLNTDVHEVEANGSEDQRRIISVTGWMMGSERRIRFESPIFLDCSGDGLIGFLAGAKYRLGREAYDEFKEDWAPEEADSITLGSTILFYTKDVGHPVKYIPPSFAKDITQTQIPIKRVIRSGDSGCHYWWIEWGGELDTVHNNERIRDELWSVIYGIWDYIKNSGKFESETMTLEWVGSIPGKREYRRFIGDYILNQNDIVSQRPFDDRIGFGGWSIDLHPPQGMYANESGSKHYHPDGIYHIPYRSLYSVNVENLMFAGRNISASHIAFGTTRVMATCAVLGQAAGTGAALCVAYGVSPRELGRSRISELQNTLLRDDAALIGIASSDERDLARKARVKASSTMRSLEAALPDETYRLDADAGLLVPVESKLEHLEFLLNATASTALTVEIWDTGRAENYVPYELQESATVQVKPGERQWVRFPISWQPHKPQNAFIIVKANDSIELYTSNRPLTGVLSFSNSAELIASNDLEDHSPDQQVIKWSMRKLVRKPFCFRALTGDCYEPAKVINGYTRPYGGPHMWVSEPQVGETEQWLELQWPSPVELRVIHFTFNDDVNEDLINLHHHRTSFDVIPELVKNYRLEAWINHGWRLLVRQTDNHERKQIHAFSENIATDRLRLIVESTNGSPSAEVVEIRAYE